MAMTNGSDEVVFDRRMERVISPMQPLRTLWVSYLLLTIPAVCYPQRVGPTSGNGAAPADSAIPEQAVPRGSDDATLRAFPRSLVVNATGLVARENLLPLLVGSGVALIARPHDDEVQGSLADHASMVGHVGDVMGDRFLVMGGVLGLFVTGQLVPEGRFREVTFDLTQGLVINGALTAILKRSVGRERPDSTNSLSFPSGHTSTSFMFATVLGYHMGLKVAIPAAAVATFIGVSRIEHNAHYLSDVVAGATLGFIVGRTVTAHVRRRGVGESQVSVSPVAIPGGGGVLVTLRL
jgi:membrane-associated phospholipid phosphatase